MKKFNTSSAEKFHTNEYSEAEKQARHDGQGNRPGYSESSAPSILAIISAYIGVYLKCDIEYMWTSTIAKMQKELSKLENLIHDLKTEREDERVELESLPKGNTGFIRKITDNIVKALVLGCIILIYDSAINHRAFTAGGFSFLHALVLAIFISCVILFLAHFLAMRLKRDVRIGHKILWTVGMTLFANLVFATLADLQLQYFENTGSIGSDDGTTENMDVSLLTFIMLSNAGWIAAVVVAFLFAPTPQELDQRKEEIQKNKEWDRQKELVNSLDTQVKETTDQRDTIKSKMAEITSDMEVAKRWFNASCNKTIARYIAVNLAHRTDTAKGTPKSFRKYQDGAIDIFNHQKFKHHDTRKNRGRNHRPVRNDDSVIRPRHSDGRSDR